MPKSAGDCANSFSFYEIFCEQYHLENVPLASVLCIYIEVDFKK